MLSIDVLDLFIDVFTGGLCVFLGPTPLHLAARCGAIDAMSCMLAINAQPTIMDQDGWLPIHHASYYDHEAAIKILAHKDENMIEYPTRNE